MPDIYLPNQSGKSDLYRIPAPPGSPKFKAPVRVTTPGGSAVELTSDGMVTRGQEHAQKEGDPIPNGAFSNPAALRALIIKRLGK